MKRVAGSATTVWRAWPWLPVFADEPFALVEPPLPPIDPPPEQVAVVSLPDAAAPPVTEVVPAVLDGDNI